MSKKQITIKGQVFKVRYTFVNDAGKQMHVIDIGNLERGPGLGSFGDEWPA